MTARGTLKIWSNDAKNPEERSQHQAEERSQQQAEKSEANRRHKSKANHRQDKSRANDRQDKSIANGRQSKPKDCEPRQGEVRGEAQYKGKLQPASPRCPAGAIRAEAWRSDHDHPSHQLQRGNRGVQERKLSRQLRSIDTESPEDRDGFSQLESDV